MDGSRFRFIESHAFAYASYARNVGVAEHGPQMPFIYVTASRLPERRISKRGHAVIGIIRDMLYVRLYLTSVCCDASTTDEKSTW